MDALKQLADVAADMLRRQQTGSITRADTVMTRPASIYTDVDLFEIERQRLFRRAPLMLAASCELPQPGDFKAIDVAGVPVLIVRGKDGTVRSFLNGCTHRGARLAEGCGHAQRLTCPYHAWTFAIDGRLLAVSAREDFGDVDPAAASLVEFPTTERAGLVWVILDADAEPEFDAFLHGIDRQLEGFGFANWTHFRTQALQGANWKLAFDAHLEFYHLPVLHRNTFGPQTSNLAQYYQIGPHQRIGLVARGDHVLGMDDVSQLASLPRTEWPMDVMLFGEWILFPNVSINCFYKGGRGVIISQVLPGATVGESTTVQIFLHQKQPLGDDLRDATEMADFLGHVVGEEDLPMSRGQQLLLGSGQLRQVLFGRNEGGLQQFHTWVERFVAAAPDKALGDIMAMQVAESG